METQETELGAGGSPQAQTTPEAAAPPQPAAPPGATLAGGGEKPWERFKTLRGKSWVPPLLYQAAGYDYATTWTVTARGDFPAMKFDVLPGTLTAEDIPNMLRAYSESGAPTPYRVRIRKGNRDVHSAIWVWSVPNQEPEPSPLEGILGQLLANPGQAGAMAQAFVAANRDAVINVAAPFVEAIAERASAEATDALLKELAA